MTALRRALDWVAVRWCWALAIVAAAILRGYQLGDQIPVGDEWHTLGTLSEISSWQALTTFDARYSAPIVLYCKAAMASFGLSELTFYGPVFLAGIALVAVAPLLVDRLLGRATADLLAWQLAISPLLVLFSRCVRPYAFTTLLATLCVAFAYQWWLDRRTSLAIAYTCCATAAVFFQVVVAVFVVAPLATLAVIALIRRGAVYTQRLKALVLIGAATAAGMALVTGIPLVTSAEAVAKKVGQHTISRATLEGTLLLFTGTDSLWFALPMAALAVLGLAVVVRRLPLFATIFATSTILQAITLAIVRPTSVGSSLVFSRYMLPALPFVLVCFSAGAVALLPSTTGRALRVAGGALVVAGVLFSGPLAASVYYTPNNWTSAVLAAEITAGDPRAKIYRRFEQAADPNGRAVSAFYHQLAARRPGSLRVVEVPWFFRLTLNRNPQLQQLHRQHCAVGMTSRISTHEVGKGEFPPDQAGVRFRNLVFVDDLEHLRRLRVNYIVLHKDLAEEVSAAELRRPRLVETLTRQSPDIPAVRRYLEPIYGAPVFEDRWVAVFALRLEAESR